MESTNKIIITIIIIKKTFNIAVMCAVVKISNIEHVITIIDGFNITITENLDFL